MNEKAEEIGLSNTSFGNSSGIEDSQNFSTVRDIATMSKHLIANYPKYYEYFKEIEFTWDRTGGDPIKQGNRNPLLYKNIGADGIKTGYLDSEKYSLAASVIGEKRRLISVISGSQTKKARSLDSIKLISWGLRNTTTYEIAEKNIPNFKFKTWLGKKDFVNGIVKEDMYVTISKKEIKGLKVTINYNGPIKAPIEKDQEVGTLIVKIDDEEIRSLPIYSSEKIEKVNFFKSLFLSFNYMIWGDA
jgi:D-alanyl-D-alanine carboxypeptidase (penicillin-binding protein 5/6)